MSTGANERLTVEQWGAALRWLLTLSLEPVKVRIKRRGNRFRFRAKMKVTNYEPDWWHRPHVTSFRRMRRWAKKHAALEE